VVSELEDFAMMPLRDEDGYIEIGRCDVSYFSKET
jgi:hypothetical protein